MCILYIYIYTRFLIFPNTAYMEVGFGRTVTQEVDGLLKHCGFLPFETLIYRHLSCPTYSRSSSSFSREAAASIALPCRTECMALTQHEAAAKPERKSILSWHWVLVLKILCALSAALVFKLQILRFNRPCRGNYSHTMRYSHPCKPRSHIAFAKSQGAD